LRRELRLGLETYLVPFVHARCFGSVRVGYTTNTSRLLKYYCRRLLVVSGEPEGESNHAAPVRLQTWFATRKQPRLNHQQTSCNPHHEINQWALTVAWASARVGLAVANSLWGVDKTVVRMLTTNVRED
jgi:hypothetical protein